MNNCSNPKQQAGAFCRWTRVLGRPAHPKDRIEFEHLKNYTPRGSPSHFQVQDRPGATGKGSRDRAAASPRTRHSRNVRARSGPRPVAAPGRHRGRASLTQGQPRGKRAKSGAEPGLGGLDPEKGIGARRRPRPQPLWCPLAARRFRYHGLRQRGSGIQDPAKGICSEINKVMRG